MNRSSVWLDEGTNRFRHKALVTFLFFFCLVIAVVSILAAPFFVRELRAQVDVTGLTPTNTPTETSTASVTPTATSTSSATPSVTLTSTPTLTVTPTPSATPSTTPTTEPTHTATAVPTATQTDPPSPAPSATEPPAATPIQATLTAVLPPPTAKIHGTTAPPDRPLLGNLWMVAIALLILATIGVGVSGVLFARRRTTKSSSKTAPHVSPPTPLPAGLGATTPAERPGPLTAIRPMPGVPYLESRSRPGGVVYCPLDKPVVAVGRDQDNDLIVDTSFQGWQTVSRRHASIEREGQRVIVSDKGSRNGTYVNNRRAGTSILQDGWLVRFGEVEFLFRSNQEGGVL